MKPSHLALFAVLLVSAGCFGYPAGTIRPGETVALLVEGAAVSDGFCYFVGGAPTALQGRAAHDVAQLTSADFKNLSCNSIIKKNVVLDVSPVYAGVAPKVAFERRFGPASVGLNFTLNGLDLVVASVNETSVSFDRRVSAPQPYPEFGLDVIFVRTGANITQELSANFTGVPFQGPVTGLVEKAGKYIVVSQRGGNLLIADMGRSATIDTTNGGLTVTVLRFQPFGTSAPVTGPNGIEYGHRESPQVG